MKLSYTDFKIWKLVEDNCKLYVFACFFIVVVVNIQNFFLLDCVIYTYWGTLKKIPEVATAKKPPPIAGTHQTEYVERPTLLWELPSTVLMKSI